ncbi:hypothetical protein [Streptomyces sp. CB02488]|uniref:hypothetical protein n=1 Tax=Streptomyces sp. CB02488 TaxID=1703920 RepID=UPI0018FE6EF9|nr:hypothetical protein [Streptomyces sp. CB02488]
MAMHPAAQQLLVIGVHPTSLPATAVWLLGLKGAAIDEAPMMELFLVVFCVKDRCCGR